jgi:predicted RecB family nuclease
VVRISSTLFDAFLKCPTKCFLLSLGESGTGNPYADWYRTQNDSYQREGIKCITAEATPDECVFGVDAAEKLKTANWRIAADIVVSVQQLESSIHAVERVPSLGRGKPGQCIPIQFIVRNKLTRDDKLLLTFNAFVLSKQLGREVGLGKIIHGDDQIATKVNTAGLVSEVQKLTGKITTLLSAKSPPDVVLNRHCSECEFQTRCRQTAIEKDELTLLATMTDKERKKLNSKGIFTVTQLSYTFRPRRRKKGLAEKREKYHHSLKALAIRSRKIHIVGSPKLKIAGTPVYLDVEGLPDRDFYYLIGIRIPASQGVIQHSLWADSLADEKQIWTDFLDVLSKVESPVLMHYGSFETAFMKRMCERYGEPPDGSGPAKAIASAVNLVSVIFGQVYFPTFSNGLKEIAGHLGFRWSDSAASGVQTIARFHEWTATREPTVKQTLCTYNTNDCEALQLVANKLVELQQQALSDHEASQQDEFVDATRLKREHPHGFKRNTFVFPELDVINKAAYWDYQRERIYVKSNKVVKHALRQASQAQPALSPNTEIELARPHSCPKCNSTKLHQKNKADKTVLDVRFMRHGVKRWIIRYRYHSYECRECGAVFLPPDRPWTRSMCGSGLIAYSIYHNIELRLPQETVDRTISKVLGFPLSLGRTHEIKTRAAKTYEETYQCLVKKLCSGQLLHADETKVSVRGRDGFVWVMANMQEVAYFYSETRHGSTIHDMLKDFKGVLVSDFYAAYDGIQCPQQKCLIHLIRDLNDEVLKHPYDEELKRLAKGFADLVKPMVESVDRHGLKSHFLRKHLASVTMDPKNWTRK